MHPRCSAYCGSQTRLEYYDIGFTSFLFTFLYYSQDPGCHKLDYHLITFNCGCRGTNKTQILRSACYPYCTCMCTIILPRSVLPCAVVLYCTGPQPEGGHLHGQKWLRTPGNDSQSCTFIINWTPWNEWPEYRMDAAHFNVLQYPPSGRTGGG